MNKASFFIKVRMVWLVFFCSLFLLAHGQLAIQPVPIATLNDNHLYNICFSKAGEMWLGSEKGLFSFDGINAKRRWNEWDSIRALDMNGNQGFFSMQKKVFTFSLDKSYTYPRLIADFPQEIAQIISIQNGIWLSFVDSGSVFIQNPIDSLKRKIIPILPNQRIQQGLRTNSQELLIHTIDSIYTLHISPQIQLKSMALGLSACQHLGTSTKGNILLIDYQNIVYEFDAQYRLLKSQTLPFNPQQIVAFLSFKEDWLIVCENTIFRYNPLTGVFFEHNLVEFFEDEKGIGAANFDKEGNLWLASKNNGLYRYGLLFEKMNIVDTEKRPIYAVYSPKPTEIWYANDEGVFQAKWEGTTWHKIKNTYLAQQKTIVTCINGDDMGNIWMGSFDKGLYVYMAATNTWRHFTESEGLNNNNILHIHFQEKNAWVATFEGISVVPLDLLWDADEHITNYNAESGFQSSYTYQSISKDTHSQLFATEGKGIILRENNLFQSLYLDKKSEPKSFYSMLIDKKGNFWALDDHNHLYLQKPNKEVLMVDFEQMGKKGLQWIHTDANDDVLIGYADGIILVEAERMQFRDYSKTYAFTKLQPNINCFADVGDNIILGTQKGIFCYFPPSPTLQHQAYLSLREIDVALKPIDFQHERTFTYDQNHFSFHFEGYWYSDPSQIRYRYQLLPQDSGFIETNNLFVNYANLPPGTYTFKVQATIHHNFEHPAEIVYKFTISPPFWMRPIFWMFALILITSGLYTIFILRERKVQQTILRNKKQIEFELQTLKSQINPHFLFNSLNTLIGIIEMEPQDAVKYVEHLSAFYRHILQYKDKELISLKEEWRILNDYLYILKQRFQENIQWEIEIDEAHWQDFIPAFTLQMLLENAVKHNIVSSYKPLRISIISKENILIISNDLQVKKNVNDSTGIGLQNIDSRFRLITGKGIVIKKTDKQFIVEIALVKSI